MPRRSVELLLASHPGPVAGVTIASAGYALAIGRGAAGIALVAAAVLAGQLSVGWHNDWMDAARDTVAARPDKPVAAGRVSRASVGIAAVTALAATIPLSIASGWRAGSVHLVAVAWAWAYNAGLKSTVASFVPYAAAFGLLPVFVSLGRTGSPLGPWWAPTAAALLGTGAHFMNTLPDLERDGAAGIRGLPHRLGRARSLAAAALLLLAAAGVLASATGHVGVLGACAVVASLAGVGAAALVAARRPSSRLPFGLTIGVALVDVGMLLADGRGLH